MMKTRAIVTFSMVALALAACGGKSDDGNTDDVTDNVDAPDVDAAPQVDAAPDNVATELGKVCTAAGNECPADAPECLAFGGGMPDHGICTLECGTSQSMQMPPAGGMAICTAQYDGSSGTPLCGGISNMNAGTYTWVCVVGCGTFDNGGTPVELGECPNGLVCTDNACG